MGAPSFDGDDDSDPDSGARLRETSRTPAVKGAWFVTARRQILESYGKVGLERVIARLGDEYAEVLADPAPSTWYSELAFQAAIGALNGQQSGGRALTVNEAKPREERPRSGGGGGGYGGGGGGNSRSRY